MDQRELVPELRVRLEHWLERYFQPKSRTKIIAECERLRFPPMEDDPTLSKSKYLQARLGLTPAADLPRLAEAVLDASGSDAVPDDRFRLEEALWEKAFAILVNKRVRREILEALEGAALFHKSEAFLDLLKRLWPHKLYVEEFLTTSESPLLRAIIRHTVQNPGDWTPAHLFEQLDALDVSHRRFCLVLEGLASSDVRPDESAQRELVATINRPLSAAGAELREVAIEDGYPVFRVVPHGSAVRRPKNVVFASLRKPDLRLSDAISNDIEIVDGADDVLIYDRSPGVHGLPWCDLQAWWEHLTGSTGDDAKRSLYRRLQRSIPSSSPPQQAFFAEYHKALGHRVPEFPALLPEVWLHWDPKTVRQRGASALLHHRMDFLLLLPHDVRAVVEVDGQHHYADERGLPSPTNYAAMVRSDRELRLRGYEVYRFGASELMPESAERTVKAFLGLFFARHGLV